MLPSKIIEMYPDDVDVLNIFTDYHWMFNTIGPFKQRDNYYLGEIRFDASHPLYLPAIQKAIEYFEQSYRYVYNSSERHSVDLQIRSLKKIKDILTANE